MAVDEHIETIRKGSKAWNKWRKENPQVRPSLSKADLRNLNFCDANLSDTDFFRSDLRDVPFLCSNLTNANFHQANLRRANFTDANLTFTDLSDSILHGANFSHATLANANVAKTRFLETIFNDTDLSKVSGIEECDHRGPSVVDYRTILKSIELPLSFLRGSGLPDSIIKEMLQFKSEHKQFYTCFISYSHEDEEFARRLHADLQNSGVRCWFAPQSIRAGRKIHTQIEEAIHNNDKLLLILSESSISSDWVTHEIKRARRKEIEKMEQVLFPIRLIDFEILEGWEVFDSGWVTDLAAEIKTYFIPDFSHWRNQRSYEEALKRLLRDLQPSE